MADKQNFKKSIILKYLKEDALKPKPTPNLTLAKIIAADNPGVFPSVEAIRNSIRFYSLKKGERAKTEVNPKDVFIRPTLTKEDFKQRFYFPSDNVALDPYILEPGKWGITGDWHYPYHDEKSLEICLEYFVKKGIKNLLINGDGLDFYECSQFEKDRSKRSIVHEMYGFRDEVLPTLTRFFKRIVFKMGNHEYRWTQYLRQQAPATFGFEEFRIDVILRLAEQQIGFVDNMQLIKAGKLDIWHGHEIKGSPFIPVNPARSAMTKYKGNIVVNHHHRTSFEPMQLANGGSYGAWSIGCLCGMSPEYYPTAYTMWNHGFGELDLDANGDFQFENWRIINGKVKHS